MTEQEAALLAAFREATGWSDDLVLHYATCDWCRPICGAEEIDCDDATRILKAEGNWP
ncbi:hypothetical protein [Microbispora sp. KK1-11]|uniref:hypothetical protein n=1 Tax=Microbispora sp. KK1-11 TaxID=2053005 RepID=UPI00163C2393|nr:hypothetical protein [Microbispora sp. KK1-11]